MAVVISGGTKGIGLAIAKRLAGPGVGLVLGYRDDEAAAREARAALSDVGARVEVVRADVGDVAGARTLVEAGAALGGGPLHIVHSAAAIYPTALLSADLDAFKRAIEVNGLSLLYLVHAAAAHLSEGSSVVFISSAGARTATLRNYAALGAGKALAESLIRYLVQELAPRGVRINAVAPGLVATTSVARMTGSEDAAARSYERAARASPSGRITEDDDYTGVVQFLLSADAAFVQGQVIHANGGSYIA